MHVLWAIYQTISFTPELTYILVYIPTHHGITTASPFREWMGECRRERRRQGRQGMMGWWGRQEEGCICKSERGTQYEKSASVAPGCINNTPPTHLSTAGAGSSSLWQAPCHVTQPTLFVWPYPEPWAFYWGKKVVNCKKKIVKL